MAAHILIIEDEEKLARFVELELVHEGYQVSRSGNGREALQMAEENSYDLLLLDIELEGKSGLQFASELRRADDRVSIIFVTGCEEYLRDGYAVQPIHFLLKPVDYPMLYDAIRTDWRLNGSKRHFVLQEGARTIPLTVQQVRFVESFNHGILIHNGEGSSFYRITLAEAEREIQPAGCFCRCHNSFLVNMDWVSEITRTRVVMRDGAQIPIGRRYYESAQKTFIRYMAQ